MTRCVLAPYAPLLDDNCLSQGRVTAPLLPSRAHLRLRISLGEKLGEGSSGLVYEAIPVEITGDTEDEPIMGLPPIVAKISKNFQYYKLPREAFIYEELAPVHGIAVARYYGCFEIIIPPGISFPPWQLEDEEPYADLIKVDHPNVSRILTMILMERLDDERLPVREKIEDDML